MADVYRKLRFTLRYLLGSLGDYDPGAHVRRGGGGRVRPCAARRRLADANALNIQIISFQN